MATINQRTPLSRRMLLSGGVALATLGAAKKVEAIEPVTMLLILLGVGAMSMTLAALARPSEWQDRRPGDVARLPPFGQPQELTPEHRDDSIALDDGGRIDCSDGSLRTVRPGATAPGRDAEVTISEALLCSKTAPYADQRRVAPSADPDLSRRRLDDLSRIWQTPMQRMRYSRPMFDAQGTPHLLLSSVARACPQTELLTLCEPSGRHWRAVSRLVAEPWTVRGARDFS